MLGLSELGERLKQARNEQNISLDDVQAITKIQVRYLRSIEEGQFDKLPGSFYTKAFVKSYAEAVGLNFETLMDTYGHELPKLPQPAETLPPRKSRTSLTPSSRSKWVSAVPGILVFFAVVLIFAVIWMLNINSDSDVTLDEQGETGQNVEVEQNEHAITDDKNQAESVQDNEKAENDKQGQTDEQDDEKQGAFEISSVSGDTTNILLSNAEKFTVSFAFSGNSWLKIQGENGKMYINDGFTDGDNPSFDFDDETSVRIRIGSAPDVQMKINDQEVKLQSKLAAQTVKIEAKSTD